MRPPPMVNRVLTSPSLRWPDRFRGGPATPTYVYRYADHDRSARAKPNPCSGGRFPLPLRAPDRAHRRAVAGQAADQPVGRRAAASGSGRYPPNKGIDAFRTTIATWLGKRFKLPRAVDPDGEVLVLNGTREGLFLAAISAARWVGPRDGKPAVLIPNPFYAAYSAGAIAAGCEPVYLPATREHGFLPDLDALDDKLLKR